MIERARAHLDPITYQIEYLGKFKSYGDTAYYCFRPEINIQEFVQYDPNLDLLIGLDFNVSPGVAVLMQDYPYFADRRIKGGLGQFKEVHIPIASNTHRICKTLLELPEVKNHPGKVIFYGDATGNAKGTAKLDGSDWEIVESLFRHKFGERLEMDIPKSNPRERLRVNAVNASFGDVNNVVHHYIHPSCEYTIQDYRKVGIKEDGSIDKDSDKKLTHFSDAAGYIVVTRNPCTISTGGSARTSY